MIATLIASGIEIPESNPSSEEDNNKDLKMAVNKKNPNLTKTNKRRKWWARQPQGPGEQKLYVQ